MHWLRGFAVGIALAIALALLAAAGYAAFDRLRPSPAAVVRSSPSSLQQPAASSGLTGGDKETKDQLSSWQASGVDPDTIKSQVMDAALAYFAQQAKADPTRLRTKITLLTASDYNGKSTSNCQDSADVRSSTEAWLLDIRGDALYLNDGFTPTTRQTAVDLFFRYTVGLYNLAPELKSYPNGVKSSDGTTVYFEKGLVLLGRRFLDQAANTSCYLQYRRPLQDAFTADQALTSLARLGLIPSPDYAYPQKASLDAYRSNIAPRLGSTAGDLLEPFLHTDSGEFYRRVGKALTGVADPAASQAAADKLFRDVFPVS